MQVVFTTLAIFQYVTTIQAYKGSRRSFLQQKQSESMCHLIKYGTCIKHENIFSGATSILVQGLKHTMLNFFLRMIRTQSA